MKAFNELLAQQGMLGGPNISIGVIVLSILTAAVLGFTISYIYKKTHSGFSYSRSFLFTLIMVTIVIALIMMVIQSNVALSLGLVGSLSVIRFRTVLKDSKDMAYLFWVICIGLCVGSGNYLMAVVATACISCIVIYLERMNYGSNSRSGYIMVLQSSADANGAVAKILDDKRLKWEVRSSMTDNEHAVKEVRYSIFSKLRPQAVEELLTDAQNAPGVKKVSLLSPETNLYV
jgi:hypothetical protein